MLVPYLEAFTEVKNFRCYSFILSDSTLLEVIPETLLDVICTPNNAQDKLIFFEKKTFQCKGKTENCFFCYLGYSCVRIVFLFIKFLLT